MIFELLDSSDFFLMLKVQTCGEEHVKSDEGEERSVW